MYAIVYSSCLDKVISKMWISITNARKLSQAIGWWYAFTKNIYKNIVILFPLSTPQINYKSYFYLHYRLASIIPAVCLIGVCLSGCQGSVVVPLMVIATTFMGSMFSGVFSNHNDLASNYAGKNSESKIPIHALFSNENAIFWK